MDQLLQKISSQLHTMEKECEADAKKTGNGMTENLQYLFHDTQTYISGYREPAELDPVLRFIHNFVWNMPYFYQKGLEDNFRDGYSYYFALMLKEAFPEGCIVWCVPYSYIAFEYNSHVYDIRGTYDGGACMFIPVDRLGKHLDIFKHIPGQRPKIPSVKTLGSIIDTWREEHHEEHIRKVTEYFDKLNGNLPDIEPCENLAVDTLLEAAYRYLIEPYTEWRDPNELQAKLYECYKNNSFDKAFVPTIKSEVAENL